MARAGIAVGLSGALLFAGAGLAMALMPLEPLEPQELQPPSWEELIDVGRCADAEYFCTGRLGATEVRQKAEAHKCLALAALCGHGMTSAGRHSLGQDFLPGAVDKALAHLNAALKLTPDDLSLHQLRLHLLGVSARYAQMEEALEESCRLTPAGSKALDTWLQSVNELLEAREPRVALSLLSVLSRRFPQDPRVLETTGTARRMFETLCVQGRTTGCPPSPQ